MTYSINCLGCGSEFTTEYKKRKYCGAECFYKTGAKAPKPWQTSRFWQPRNGRCKQCGGDFWMTSPKHFFCSKECHKTWTISHLPASRECKTCLEEKPIDLYGQMGILGHRRADCKDCVRGTQFGLAKGEYTYLLTSQGGVCLICGDAGDGRNLAVDHDHDTGAVRGLLCQQCNTGLGLFKDNSARLIRASEYLQARAA